MVTCAWRDGGGRAWIRLAASVALATLPACAEVPVVEDQPGYHLVTEEIWSGGDLMLVSPSFQGMIATVRAVIDGDTFPTVYRHADTVVFRPTIARSGTYSITVVPTVLPEADSPDQVTIRGFHSCYAGPSITGFVLPWPRGSAEPTFVADGAESAVIVNARTGTARAAVPDSQYFPGRGHGPGFSYDPSAVVLMDTRVTPDVRNTTCEWRLTPTPEVRECIGVTSTYSIALAGPNKWVDARHHLTWRYWDPDSTAFQLEEPDGLALSPRGDFVIVSGAHADGQLVIPVSDEPAFRIPVLVSAEAPAAFSPDGDTVYMAGWTEFGHGTAHLVALDLARPTEPLAQVVLGEWDPLDVAVDPLAPFLYIISA